MSNARARYTSAVRGNSSLGGERPESAAQRAEREAAERKAMLLQTMGQLLPIVGTVGGGLVGAGIGGLASGGAGIAPGAALGSAIGGGVGQAGQVAAGAGSAAMTEPYDRAEFERQERERRRQNLLATAASIGPRR